MTVYYYFHKWRDEGVFEQLSALLVGEARQTAGAEPRNHRLAQREDLAPRGRGPRIDGNKKVKGRKQHVVTDSLGLVIGAAVHSANVHDSKGAMLVLDGLRGASRRLTRIIANGGYRGRRQGDGELQEAYDRLRVPLRLDRSDDIPCERYIALNKVLKHAP